MSVSSITLCYCFELSIERESLFKEMTGFSKERSSWKKLNPNELQMPLKEIYLSLFT